MDFSSGESLPCPVCGAFRPHVDKEPMEDKFVQRWRRDRERMRLAYAGMTNKEIGARLGITEQWVSALIQRRFREGWTLQTFIVLVSAMVTNI